MADEATTDTGTGNAPQTSGQAPETPSNNGFSIPEGQRLVPESEYTQYRRSHDQYKGAEPMIQAMVKAGYKTPEDIQKIADLRAQGFDLDSLARSFKKPVSDREAETPTDQMTRDELMELLDNRDSKSSATFEHKTAFQKQNDMVQSLINELAGDDANDFDKGDWKLRIRGYMADNMVLYENGHPLAREDYRPYGEAEVKSLRDHFKGVAEKRAAAGTAEVAKGASEAKRKPAPMTAGDSGGQGKAHDSSGSGETDDERKARLTAFVEKRQASRAGNPVS